MELWVECRAVRARANTHRSSPDVGAAVRRRGPKSGAWNARQAPRTPLNSTKKADGRVHVCTAGGSSRSLARTPEQWRAGPIVAIKAPMDTKEANPSAHIPGQSPSSPLGDRGRGDKTWVPPAGEQGISNRVNDDDPEAAEAPDPGNTVERGGEVRPDSAGKGSERDTARHERGIPED
jgi:hypothetical protein